MKHTLIFLAFWTSISIAQDHSLIIKNTGNSTITITPSTSDGDHACGHMIFRWCTWNYGGDPCNNILNNTYQGTLKIAPKKQYQIINGSDLEDDWWGNDWMSHNIHAKYCKYSVYNTNSSESIGLRISDYQHSTCILTHEAQSIDALYDGNETVNVSNGTGKQDDHDLCQD